MFFLQNIELNTKPADLSERVIFKSKSRPKTIDGEQQVEPKESQQRTDKKSKSKSASSSSSKLSFAFDVDEEDDD